MKQYDSIQVLRGLAASAVMIAHAIGTQNLYAERGWVRPLAFQFELGAAGVDIFFLITGFIMVGISKFFTDHPITTGDFFRRRLARLAPVYWLYTTAMLAAYLGFQQYFHTLSANALSIAGSYLFLPFPRPDGLTLPLIPPGWSLDLEVMYYFVFGMCLFLPKYPRIAVAVTIVLCFGLYGLTNPASWQGRWLGNDIYIEFLYGMFIGWLTFKRLNLPQAWAWVAMFAGFTLLALFPPAPEMHLHLFEARAFTWGPCALLIVLGAVSIERRMPRVLVLLGDASYSIYLTQAFSVPLAYRVMSTDWNPLASLLACTSVALVAGLAAYSVIERPLVSFCHRRFSSSTQDMPQIR